MNKKREEIQSKRTLLMHRFDGDANILKVITNRTFMLCRTNMHEKQMNVTTAGEEEREGESFDSDACAFVCGCTIGAVT